MCKKKEDADWEGHWRKHLPPKNLVPDKLREASKRPNAYYSHANKENVEQLETHCLLNGTEIEKDEGDSSRFIRWFWIKRAFLVGYSQGVDTEYMIVRWDTNTNGYHGFPITEQALRNKGAAL